MSWSIVVAGEGNAVALDVERQAKALAESTWQTPASREQAGAAGVLLAGFARGFPGRLVSVTASGHSDTSADHGYGSMKIEATTLIAPKA